jgi:hypothetical protein
MFTVRRRLLSVNAILAIVSGPIAGAQSTPALQYDPPASFYKSASASPADFSSSVANASMQVYAFRTFSGDIAQQFQRTFLREWIDPQFRELNVASPPQYSQTTIAGARTALIVRFLENVAGTMKQHMRIVIVSSTTAAVVDLSANSAASWSTAAPAMLASLNSMKLVDGAAIAARAEAAPPSPGDGSFAGIYMAMTSRYLALYGTSVSAPYFYMFSRDGRLYRTYEPPAGDIQAFDYVGALRTDPGNSGRWVRRGNQIVMRVGSDEVIGYISSNESFKISGLSYWKQ